MELSDDVSHRQALLDCLELSRAATRYLVQLQASPDHPLRQLHCRLELRLLYLLAHQRLPGPDQDRWRDQLVALSHYLRPLPG